MELLKLPFLSLSLLFLLPYFSAAYPDPDPFAFIRASCNATLYPNRCYASLSHYAHSIHHDPAHLARIAIGVSLVRAHLTQTRFARLTLGPDPMAISALHDCRSVFADAVGQMRGSIKQMRQLGSEDEVKFQVSNVQTWMSAALTNVDTCTDGFDEVEDGPVKEEVCEKVGDVRELTSNALALVNTFANSVID